MLQHSDALYKVQSRVWFRRENTQNCVIGLHDRDNQVRNPMTPVLLSYRSHPSTPPVLTYTGYPPVLTYTGYPPVLTYTGYPPVLTYTGYPPVLTYTGYPPVLTYTGYPPVLTYTGYPPVLTYTGYPPVLTYTGYGRLQPNATYSAKVLVHIFSRFIIYLIVFMNNN